MDITGSFIGQVIAIVCYVMIFLAVYKLFQIGTDLSEIKNLLKSGQRAPAHSLDAPASDPDAYAENLLRAVNQESNQSEHAAQHD